MASALVQVLGVKSVSGTDPHHLPLVHNMCAFPSEGTRPWGQEAILSVQKMPSERQETWMDRGEWTGSCCKEKGATKSCWPVIQNGEKRAWLMIHQVLIHLMFYDEQHSNRSVWVKSIQYIQLYMDHKSRINTSPQKMNMISNSSVYD